MLLDVRGVTAGYGLLRVLHDASLHADAGEVVALLGRNGVGKSTLVSAVSGMLRPVRGAITFNGRRIESRSPEDISRMGLSTLPQGHRIFRSLSVGEHLEIACDTRARDGWTIKQVVADLPLLKERWRQKAKSLSGGEQQILTLGRTLVRNGCFVMLDEPVEGLAPAMAEQVATIIGRLRERDQGVLLVEQRLDFALALADRVYLMSRGATVWQGPPAQLRSEPGLMREYLGLGTARSDDWGDRADRRD